MFLSFLGSLQPLSVNLHGNSFLQLQHPLLLCNEAHLKQGKERLSASTKPGANSEGHNIVEQTCLDISSCNVPQHVY